MTDQTAARAASSPQAASRRGLWLTGIALSLALLALIGLIWVLTSEPAPSIHVRWRDSVTPERRAQLEADFRLIHAELIEGNSWAYDFLDTSGRNIQALVQHPDVADTHEIDRQAFVVRPEAPDGDSRMWLAHRTPGLRRPGTLRAVIVVLLLLLGGSLIALVFDPRAAKRPV